MMNKYDLGNDQYLEFKNNQIIFHCRYEHKTLVSWKNLEINGNELKRWLKKVLEPKYIVTKGVEDNYYVQDNETGNIIVSFYEDMEGLDPEREAVKFCFKLNNI